MRDRVGPGLTVCCFVDGWLVVAGSVVVPVGSVQWVAGLGLVCCVCWGFCSLGLRSVGRGGAQAGFLSNLMLALAGDGTRATFVITHSPKMVSTWRVPMASRRSPSSWMVLTAPTSMGDQSGDGALKVVSVVFIALVLEGWRGVRDG